MNDRMKGYRAEKISEDHEIEALETAEPELVPDPEATVPTGDEAVPVSAGDPKEARKVLYEKARKRRELVSRADAEGAPDVARVEALVREASGGKREADEPIDTNRKSRNDDDTYEERVKAARQMAEGQQEARSKKHEPEIVNKDEEEAPDALPDYDPNATVDVKILGKQYSVPQQDIDDAGGVEAYQKSRAATIRLQRAATLEQRALQAQKELDKQLEAQQEADPSSDGLGEADVDSLREELMDTVINGTEDDINKWIAGRIEQAQQAAKKSPPEPKKADRPAESAAPKERTETQRELDRQFEDDMREANDMMRTEYRDIMGDPELMQLAQQRFRVLVTNPSNEGRTQKEMARESAEYVRGLGKRLLTNRPANEVEQQRQTRIARKRKLPQTSRADTPAAAPPQQEKHIPSAKDHFMRLRRMQGHES